MGRSKLSELVFYIAVSFLLLGMFATLGVIYTKSLNIASIGLGMVKEQAELDYEEYLKSELENLKSDN